MENRPLVAVDPTGHDPVWCNDPYDAGGGPECNSVNTPPPPDLPDYVLLYQITLNDRDKYPNPFSGTLTFIDSDAALTSNHFLGDFAPDDIRRLSIIDPNTGTEVTIFGPSNTPNIAIHYGSELGDMENGLTLLIFPWDVLPDIETASIGEVWDNVSGSALQAVTFNPDVANGLYSTQIVGTGPARRKNGSGTYLAIFVQPTSTTGGDSGAPLIVNGTVRGINNGQGEGMGMYGRITDIELLRTLITNYSP